MNPRIKELAEQAQLDGDSIHYYNPAFAEKFALLIVKKCFDVVIADGRFHDAKGVIRAGKSVAMEHFGVKE